MMTGQLSIFDDMVPEGRPCKYAFRRYIGQRVRLMIGAYPGRILHGVITRIDNEYYTTIEVDGKEYVGTPYDLSED